jgi:hypothetical protein
MSMADDETLTLAQKQKKAEPIQEMQDQFGEIMRLLRKAGAREPEDD